MAGVTGRIMQGWKKVERRRYPRLVPGMGREDGEVSGLKNDPDEIGDEQ